MTLEVEEHNCEECGKTFEQYEDAFNVIQFVCFWCAQDLGVVEV